MKESILKISEELRSDPKVEFTVEDDFIKVIPDSETGFEVSLYDCGDQIIVGYGGWHEHFTEFEEARKCFFSGLNGKRRLKVESRASFDYKWTVQSEREDKWEDVDVSGLLLFPFWRKHKVRYLQNKLKHLDS